MRGYTGGVVDVDPGDSGDSGEPDDPEPEDDTAPPDSPPPTSEDPEPTTCDTGGGVWFAWPLVLLAIRRRR